MRDWSGPVRREMPAYADVPVRRLVSSGSTNALFRLGDELVVRLPRQPGGSASISREATWLPVLGPLLPVSVPEVLTVFETDYVFPERWSVVRWINGVHPEVVDPGTSIDPRREELATNLARSCTPSERWRYPRGRSTTHTCSRTAGSRSKMDGDPREDRISPVHARLRLRSRCHRADLGRSHDAARSSRPTAPRWYDGDRQPKTSCARRSPERRWDFGGVSSATPQLI